MSAVSDFAMLTPSAVTPAEPMTVKAVPCDYVFN
tara:strand:- start:789 stop:890 length:102 start_codon:yes stop_codon:yes gene_type:complete